MSKTFQPESLHPYIMDDRLKKATGSGGIGNIPIASADTVGGIMIGGSANPITITSSGNASVRKATSELLGVVKAGDGVSVDADGAISGVAYSTTEHKTGRKWKDGKDIYERTIELTITSIEDTSTVVATNVDYVESLIDSNFTVQKANVKGCERGCAFVSANNELKLHLVERWGDIITSQVTIQYTKPTL